MGRKHGRIRWGVCFGLWLGGAGLTGCPRDTDTNAQGHEPAHETAPVRVEDLQGRSIDPLPEGEAAAAVFVFVSTHCPISNRYAPTLRALHDDLLRRGSALTLVYPDPDDDRTAIEAHREEYGLSMPAFRDPTHQLVRRTGVRVTPEAALVQRRGGGVDVRYRGRIDDRATQFGSFRARANHRDLEQAIDAVWQDRQVARPAVPAVGCYISDLR